jgi:hypothetical protein
MFDLMPHLAAGSLTSPSGALKWLDRKVDGAFDDLRHFAEFDVQGDVVVAVVIVKGPQQALHLDILGRCGLHDSAESAFRSDEPHQAFHHSDYPATRAWTKTAKFNDGKGCCG